MVFNEFNPGINLNFTDEIDFNHNRLIKLVDPAVQLSSDLGAKYSDYMGSNPTPSARDYYESKVFNRITSYYSFDDADTNGTTVEDITGSNNDGTNNGATTGVTGIINEAYDFDGLDDYIDLGNITPSSYPFTLSAWINTSTVNSSSLIRFFDSSSPNTTAYSIFIDGSGGRARIVASGSTGEGTTTVNDGSWHLITGVFTSSGHILYVDGSQEATLTASTFDSSIDKSEIGRDGPSIFNNRYLGKLDEAGIWEIDISATQVSELYNSGNGLQYTDDGVSQVPADNSNTSATVNENHEYGNDSFKYISDTTTNIGVEIENEFSGDRL